MNETIMKEYIGVVCRKKDFTFRNTEKIEYININKHSDLYGRYFNEIRVYCNHLEDSKEIEYFEGLEELAKTRLL